MMQEMTLLLNNTDESFVLLDSDLSIILFNKQFHVMYHKYFGIDVEKGRSIIDFVQPHRKEIVRKIYDRVLQGETMESEIEFALRDGSLHVFVNRFKPAFDENGAIAGAFVTIHDITEKKKSEHQLITSERRFRALVENGSDAIAILSANGAPTYISPSVETILGFTEEEILHNDGWALVHDDDIAQMLNTVAWSMQNHGITSPPVICRARHKNGSWRWLEATFTNMLQDPAVNGIVDNFRDITEQKSNEISISSLNEQLNKRAEELAASNAELENFAYVASHDLQEPLRMVSSFLQLLERKYEGQIDETAKQYINFAVDGADRMKRLILDLLEYSRVNTNHDLRTPTNMSSIINQVLDTYGCQIEKRNAIIKVPLLPTVNVNHTQMIQLFQNLLGNALKYNKSEVPEIEISVEEKEDMWQFSVKDNGIGIEPKFFERVFIIFQRLHTKSQYSGTGIGLAICKKIVEKHGGKIWIESSLGNGCTFFFTLKK